MGWTDNGKIMRPCIILSEERETGREKREGNGGTETEPSKRVFPKELQCFTLFKVVSYGAICAAQLILESAKYFFHHMIKRNSTYIEPYSLAYTLRFYPIFDLIF